MTAELPSIGGRPVIIGGGLAGLMTALRRAPEPVVVLSKAPLGTEASSAWAQGEIAAALGPDDDPALHLAGTLAAGGGLCDPEMAGRIVRAAPAASRIWRGSAPDSIARWPAACAWDGRRRTACDASSMPPATAPDGKCCVR